MFGCRGAAEGLKQKFMKYQPCFGQHSRSLLRRNEGQTAKYTLSCFAYFLIFFRDRQAPPIKVNTALSHI